MKKRKRSLKTTILVAMILLVVVTFGVIYYAIFAGMSDLQENFITSNTRLGEMAGYISSATVSEEVSQRMQEVATGKADIVDAYFADFKASVELIASDATYLYEHADEYGRIPISEPKAENDGTIVVHLSYSEDTDITDPAIMDEIGILGNESNTLISTNEGNPSMAKCYIATETGLMIEADAASSDKLGKNGVLMPYDPRVRPWYTGTKDANATYFTNVVPEANGKRIGFMCGSPITKDGEFMGVACAGIYLDDVEAIVDSTDLGEDGIALVINNNGQRLFSSDNKGELAITRETADLDLRESSNEDLAAVVTDAVNGVEDNRTITVNGEEYFVAFAPMETVGWSFFTFIPESTVQAPTNHLLENLNEITTETEEGTIKTITRFRLTFIIVGIFFIILASFMARVMAVFITAPLEKLTKKVTKVRGDDLEFTWEDVNDLEIQTLAESFGNMTERMKNYIDEVTRITAEKERIGAELSVATQIQADMLPRIFPPFPERKEFELYSLMDPAKEVGGDFYDFFLIDDDHLGLVVADVSGKGVPAALFMVIAKTLIKNRAQMGGGPAEILTYVNDQLCEGNDSGLFVTVWFAIIEISTGKGLAANAGHEHPALRRRDGSFELIKYKHSPAVATMEGIKFREHEFELFPGDTLFEYSDGVTEATDADNKLYGDERLIEALNRDADADTEKIIRNVREDIDGFVGTAPQFDDITMLCFKYFGKD